MTPLQHLILHAVCVFGIHPMTQAAILWTRIAISEADGGNDWRARLCLIAHWTCMTITILLILGAVGETIRIAAFAFGL
jgi:hypothetical protein